ncbi:MAG: hypothetical protein ACYDEX_19115 [Mobilitalea sp.]
MKKNNVFILIAGIILVIVLWFTKFRYMASRGMRNNNPFNIRFSILNRWQGLVGEDKKEGEKAGFCKFDTLESGVRAGVITLKNGYFKNHMSIFNIVNKYAPTDDNNNVNNYVNHIVKYSPDFSPGYIPKNLHDYVLVCKAIVRFEQGFDAVNEDLIVKYLNL